MRYTLKKKLSYCNQSDWVQSVTKTRQNNGVIDHINMVYTKTEMELLGSIWPSVVYDEN